MTPLGEMQKTIRYLLEVIVTSHNEVVNTIVWVHGGI